MTMPFLPLPSLRRLALAGLLALPLTGFAQTAETVAKPADLGPQVTGTVLSGDRFDSRQAAGQDLLVMLWSPDSMAARKSLGEFGRFAAQHPELRIVALATPPADAATLRQFAEARGLRFPVGVLGQHALGQIAAEQLPIVLHYDGKGRLLGRRAGLFRLRDLDALLNAPKPVEATPAR